MSNNKYCRRSFLRGLGISAMLLPMFDLEFEKPARGDAPKAPKRFAALCWPEGVTNNYWPTGTETNFQLTDVLSPLAPHKQDVLIFDGLDNRAMMDQFPNYGGHAALPYVLTGGPGKYLLYGDDQAMGDSISLDQELAKTQTTPYKSLVLGIDNQHEGNPGSKYLSLAGPAIGNQPNAPVVLDDVHAIYKQLFAGASMDPEYLAKVRAERKSILDHVGKDLERFGGRMGSESKQKVDLHLTSVRELEQRLDAVGTTYKPAPDDTTIDPYNVQHYDRVARAQMDMIIGAFASGQTNIATLLMSNSHNNMWVFYWLGGDFAQAGDGSFNPLRSHHELGHRGGDGTQNNDDSRRKDTVDKYFVSLFAYFIEKAKAVPELGGTMLDNCCLLATNVMGNGSSHQNTRLPWILAGSCGGFFRTGRLIKWAKGMPHNRLLVTVGNAMGHSMTSFGAGNYGGALPELS